MIHSLPEHDDMYDSLLRREPGMDGVFYVAVKTTGIFCRPVCPSRMPLRQNVEFFATVAEAIEAGYRACKRCRPLEGPGSVPGEISALAEAVRADPSQSWTAAELRDRGRDPATVRRKFARYYGQSFAAYVRAQRLSQASERLARGTPVIDAQLEAGFESGSGFREAFARYFRTAPSKQASVSVFAYDWMETPLGSMLAIADHSGLRMLEFVERKSLRENLDRFRRSENAILLPQPSPVLDEIRSELDAYFAGECLEFRSCVAPAGTPFQQSVWDELRRLRPGETETYAGLAGRIGRPAAVRAVANANANNRLALILPCHRIVGSDGSLTGYAAGIWRKQWLLDHERRYSGG